MTQEDIIRMAREADLIDDTYASDWYVYQLQQFAALVRADERELVLAAAIDGAEHAARKAVIDEREACAKVCETALRNLGTEYYANLASQAIRARGQA